MSSPVSLRSLLVALGLLSWVLGLSGCSSPPAVEEADEPRAEAARPTRQNLAAPPFFRVSGRAGADLLVMGTIHLGPPSGWRYAPGIEDGMAGADEIVLEIDLRTATEEAVSTLVAQRALLQPPTTLDDVIAPETAKLVAEHDTLLAQLGLPAAARGRLKPWFIAMGVIESTAQRSGYSTEASVENMLLSALAGRPLTGLETLEEQMALLDDLSLELQDILLRDTLMHLDDAIPELERLIAAWRDGDEQSLAEIARDGIEELPELEAFYEILIDQRNRRWLSTLRPMLEDRERAGQTLFVGVGALHVVGPGGLAELFRAAGYRVEPIDSSRPLELRGS